MKIRRNKRPWIKDGPKAQKMEDRVRSHALYHTSRWTKASRRYRELHPLCEECKREGITTAAEVVDHITPFPICKDFFDESNWQALCQRCNIEKGNKDKKLLAKFKGEGV